MKALINALYDLGPDADRALLLTANRRLAAYVRRQLPRMLMKDGQSALALPTIQTFDEWIEASWNRELLACRVPAYTVLNDRQDLWFWERAVSASATGDTLLSTSGAAQLAKQAYALLCDWQLAIDDHDLCFALEAHPDSRAFLAWYREYLALLPVDWVNAPDRKRLLLAALNRQHSALSDSPASVLMIGFQAPSPLQRALTESAYPGHLQLSYLDLCDDASDTITAFGVERLADSDAEIRRAAQWAYGLHADDPNAHIAVVVQDLQQRRAQVEYEFLKVFEPAALASGAIASNSVLNISAGTCLADTQPAMTALDLLALGFDCLPRDRLIKLLASPYLGAENELSQRLALIDYCAESGLIEMHLGQLIRLAEWRGDAALAAGSLQRRFVKTWQRLQRQLRKRKHFTQWLALFTELLELFDWPGERVPNTDEYQQIQRFRDELDALRDMDAVCGELTARAALAECRKACRAAVYHRENKASVVEVLGGLEASGLPFDHLRLLGMSGRQWPLRPSPHPLLPQALQAQHAMPGATAEREFDYAQRQTRAYLRASHNVVVSFPARLDDVGCALAPIFDQLRAEHGLIESLHDIEPLVLPSEPPFDNALALQYIDDSRGRELPIGPLGGGVTSLMRQSTCPFQAYASVRLGIRAAADASHGITAMEKGIALHRAMELLWRELGGSAALRDCSGAQRAALVEEVVDSALPAALRKRFEPAGQRLVAIERQRLLALISRWLEVELARPEFVVEQTEAAATLRWNNIELSLRIDRIDRLHDGKRLLVDYKSGRVNAAGWFGERVLAPQLPAYLLTESSGADALLYAKLSTADWGYAGVASEPLNISGVNTIESQRGADADNWDEQSRLWRQAVVSLIEELQTGLAAVAPANSSSCQYCHLHSVCRIRTTEFDQEQNDGELTRRSDVSNTENTWAAS